MASLILLLHRLWIFGVNDQIVADGRTRPQRAEFQAGMVIAVRFPVLVVRVDEKDRAPRAACQRGTVASTAASSSRTFSGSILRARTTSAKARAYRLVTEAMGQFLSPLASCSTKVPTSARSAAGST